MNNVNCYWACGEIRVTQVHGGFAWCCQGIVWFSIPLGGLAHRDTETQRETHWETELSDVSVHSHLGVFANPQRSITYPIRNPVKCNPEFYICAAQRWCCGIFKFWSVWRGGVEEGGKGLLERCYCWRKKKCTHFSGLSHLNKKEKGKKKRETFASDPQLVGLLWHQTTSKPIKSNHSKTDVQLRM